MTLSRPIKLSSPEVENKTSQKPQLDGWNKKSSLCQSEVNILTSVKLKAKKANLLLELFKTVFFLKIVISKTVTFPRIYMNGTTCWMISFVRYCYMSADSILKYAIFSF